VPAVRLPAHTRPLHAIWRRLAGWAALWLAACSVAHAGALAERVLAIEAAHGSNAGELLRLLAPMEAQARASQGDDLRIFLAAWGYAHAVSDKPAVTEAAIEELTEIGERTGDAQALASAYALKANALQMAGQVRAAFGWIESAVSLAKASPNHNLRYWIYMSAGELATANGQVEEGIRLAEGATEAARQGRNPRREAQALLVLAPLRLVRGETAAALGLAERVRALALAAGDTRILAAGWILEALAAEALGDQARSGRARQSAASLRPTPPASAASAGPGAGEGWMTIEVDTLLALSGLHLSVGNFANAGDLARRAHRQAEGLRDESSLANGLVNIGLADLGLGRIQSGMKAAADGLAMLEARSHDAALLIQLNRYVAALERRGETSESWRRLQQALLLETELSRRDRQSTVLALQRESSFQQRQRHVEQLQHDNALQSAEISRRAIERTLSLLLAAAMGAGGIAAWRLYRRADESNRRLAQNNASLAFASTHDAVTGLLNRRAMEADTEALAGTAYDCVSLSVKQFSLIVGSVGHQQGDQLLCQIADRLEAAVNRFNGRLYRLDGVSFCAIVQPDGAAPINALLAALAACMDKPFGISNQDFIVSVGVGAAAYPRDAGSPAEVARLAELARLQAHGEPGNTSVVYDARIGEHQRDKLHMEARMLKALEQGEFELFYQAQRDLTEGAFSGFEALLRWRDGGTMVSPAQFIPLAEESGLIVPIGTWVLRQACQQAKAWADEGLGVPKVAVNISPRQFNHPDFMVTVRAALRDTGVDPAQIELEITEGSVMNDAEASIAQLHALRGLGLKLAIDDFGTGYASLSYLRRFPLDRLKIDRSFVMQLGRSAHDDTIVRTVIELAHCLGLSVTAEGVETAEQETMLHAWSCNQVQGFLHSRPGPAAGATELLRAQQRAPRALTTA
jgi:diguanylate cyclase (GGDEF)-like protein